MRYAAKRTDTQTQAQKHVHTRPQTGALFSSFAFQRWGERQGRNERGLL